MAVVWAKRATVALSVCGLLAAGVFAASTAGASAPKDDHGAAEQKHSSKKHAQKKHAAKKHAAKKHKGHQAAPAADDKGLARLSNGHHAGIAEEMPLTIEERAELSRQIDGTIATAKKYPTVADALAAGYKRTGPYMPGIGAHYILIGGQGLNADGAMDDADIAAPLAMVYAGTDPTSVIAGFMYYSMSKDEPAGFSGAKDVWHYHEALCLKYTAEGIDVPYGLDNSATKKQCDSVGGSMLKQSQWMVHVWSVPGWESRQGLFGEVNPALMCPDGTYYQLPPKRWNEHPLNSCKSAS